MHRPLSNVDLIRDLRKRQGSRTNGSRNKWHWEGFRRAPPPLSRRYFTSTRRTVTKSALSWTTDKSMQSQCETTTPSLAYGKPWKHCTAATSSRSLTYNGATATFAYRRRTNTRQPYRRGLAPISLQ